MCYGNPWKLIQSLKRDEHEIEASERCSYPFKTTGLEFVRLELKLSLLAAGLVLNLLFPITLPFEEHTGVQEKCRSYIRLLHAREKQNVSFTFYPEHRIRLFCLFLNIPNCLYP